MKSSKMLLSMCKRTKLYFKIDNVMETIERKKFAFYLFFQPSVFTAIKKGIKFKNTISKA
jgi:hypothetical protein